MEGWLDRGGGSSERVSATAGRGAGGHGKWGAGEDSGTWRRPQRGWRDGWMDGWLDGSVEVDFSRGRKYEQQVCER